MRPIMNLKMCVSVAVALAAPAVAPIPAFAASADYYLKLGDVKGELAARSGKPVPSGVEGGKHIEILSWSWGSTMTVGGDGTGVASDAKYGAVAGAHRDDSLSLAEKRQHGWVAVARPLDRGAVRVKVKFPWLDCKVGAAFPDAMLQNDAGRFEFKDAIITHCAPDSVSLNYAKVIVRGWNPEKKEE